MDLVCKAPSEAFRAGRVAAFLLLANPALADRHDLMVFAQAHGHVQVSDKWIRAPAQLESLEKSKSSSHSLSLDAVTSFPADPTPEKNSVALSSSRCLFASHKVALSPQSLCAQGVFVECELPSSLLPSCRGRAVRVNYYLSVQLQIAGRTRSFHFPFVVHSSGPSPAPLAFACGGIHAFPVSTLPEENFLHSELSQQLARDDSDGDFAAKKSPCTQFSVRDKGFICSVSLPSTQWLIGEGVELDFDFSSAEQSCAAVKASLVMSEKRTDDSTIQERTECSVLKNAEDAESLILRIHVPSECSSSFTSPIVKIEHVLLFEFFLSDENGEVQEEPLSFTVPVTLLHHSSIPASTSPRLSRHDSTQLCLSSTLIRVPIVIDS